MIRRVILLLFDVGLGACSGSADNTVPATASADECAAGEVLFAVNCADRHGLQASGTEQGPPLVHAYQRPGHQGDTAFHLAVRNGDLPQYWNSGSMPPVTGVSDPETDELVAYVRSLREGASIG